MRAEAKPPRPEDALSDSDAGRPAGVPEGLSEPVRHALGDLREAVDGKKVEPICAAYRELREACRGMKVKDMLDLADRALGTATVNPIVSAFSHLHCYMCNDGAMVCDQCEGTGRLEHERTCPQCDGFAVLPCNFCRGGGWAERGLIPPEIRRTVLERQLGHVRKDAKRLADSLPLLTVRNINRLTQVKRRELIAWLIRLQARMKDLVRAGDIVDPLEKARLTAAAGLINSRLEELAES